MQFLFELLPLIAFLVAFKLGGIYVATATITAAVVLQVGYRLIRRHKLTAMQIASAALLLTFGGLTLILHDDRFILWKPTVFYWAVAASLMLGHLFTRAPVIKILLGEAVTLSDARWARLSWIWAGYFSLLGVLNIYVAYSYSRDTWVMFKFVLLGLFFVFMVIQGWWIIARWNGLKEEPAIDNTDQMRP